MVGNGIRRNSDEFLFVLDSRASRIFGIRQKPDAFHSSHFALRDTRKKTIRKNKDSKNADAFFSSSRSDDLSERKNGPEGI